MGRKKIQISRILDERNRQVTFMKRKFGLMKKAYELSVLCDCEIALIIFNSSNKLFQYASTDMDKVLLKYTEYNEPHESRTNTDILEALRKKEHRGCDSPDESSYVLTPSTEEKYKKINEEFDNMMKSHKISTGQPQQHFMHAASGSTTYCHGAGGGGGVTSQALAAATAVLSDSGILCSPHTHTHRNTNSSQRPPSTGNTGGLQGSSDLALHNGSGAAVNGFMGSSGGGILGKTGPAKSPPSLPHHASGGHKGDLRVVIPHCKGMMLSNQRLGGGQSAQPLSTPVVSIATPSLTHQGLGYSSISSAYSSAADYSLNSADMTGFGSAADHSLGSMTPWEQHQLSSLGSANSNLSISTSHNINIKAEPISPPRDHLSQPRYMTHHPAPPRPTPPPPGSLSSQADLGRSPTSSVGSSCSSHEDGSDREEQQQQQKRRSDLHPLPAARSDGAESPTVKQMRMDSWVT
ncbi:myocyte-specific enhancer factor 2A-like [Poecilia formosa]|uniref:Myocyte-specific enhancer factor 2A-like n=1 Tax=Poecilia formosa TaxID=48698 RepID=A0A087YJU7_POEFO|nr:PREDICTED: myocyte-specific enhancer factor 2A-like [Poecilia formosa]XP_007549159.1 PREDICTED: myocyte-specific enhancer factor 2A-like [Poecilia formosa]XP_016525418.1 PREDICTED: myocyte-specific enhancer factor 2A-like [Poecilia formosa]